MNKKCSYPYPRVHKKGTLLPVDSFRVLSLQRDSLPKPYVTDNCDDCLNIAGEKFEVREYRHEFQVDSELLAVMALPVSTVEAAIQYLEDPPPIVRPEPKAWTPEQVEHNRKEYKRITGQFPKPERKRTIKTSSTPNPQVAENNTRRANAIKSGTWVEKFKVQDGKCACCKDTFVQMPHLDHDHRTGQLRGLLCANCNSVIAHAKDSVDRLRYMITYLTRWQQTPLSS